MDASEIARIAVEKSLITTHRNVFGVFFWFLMPLGPAGAVLYRVAEYLARAWNEPDTCATKPSASSPRAPSTGSTGFRCA
jgi:cobalamin biosynthesis protein CobD/CbiB